MNSILRRCRANNPAFPWRRPRRGFTLVELLVVISVIGLLVAVLMPALGAARDAARKSACQNNLRQCGVGLHAYAEAHSERFCSGAFSWELDGAVTEIGWVADLVNRNITVGGMLCPANNAKLSETYKDLMEMNPNGPNACNVDWKGSPPSTYPDGTQKINPCRKIAEDGSLAPGSDARRTFVEEQVLKKWYNTNYASSWFLVRASVNLNSSGQLTSTAPGCTASNTSRKSTGGPLSRRLLESGGAPMSMVPFLGDARPLPLNEKSLGVYLGDHTPADPLAASTTAGPVDPATGQPPNPASGSDFSGSSGWWSIWSKAVQDYRNFGAVHGGACNVLFADGRVKALIDANGDAQLNNGIDTTMPLEVQPEEIYSGWSLRADLTGK